MDLTNPFQSVEQAQPLPAYRQGDVLVRRIPPRDVRKMKRIESSGRVILARGEATGHAHAIDASKAELFRSGDGRRYLRLSEAALLEHEEHAPIALPEGFYEVIRQREYSPRGSRRVAD